MESKGSLLPIASLGRADELAQGQDPTTFVTTCSSVAPSITPASVEPIPRTASATGRPAPGLGGVFAALNKGEGVTSGLKKVDKSEMVHKNPELRGSGVVSAVVGGGQSPSSPTLESETKWE